MKIASLLVLLASILIMAGLALIGTGWIELPGQVPLEPVRFEPLDAPAASARLAPPEESPATRTVVAGDAFPARWCWSRAGLHQGSGRASIGFTCPGYASETLWVSEPRRESPTSRAAFA